MDIWICCECFKLFRDSMLEDRTQVSADEVLEMINTNAIICVECATDAVRLSSTTNLHARSNLPSSETRHNGG